MLTRGFTAGDVVDYQNRTLKARSDSRGDVPGTSGPWSNIVKSIPVGIPAWSSATVYYSKNIAPAPDMKYGLWKLIG